MILPGFAHTGELRTSGRKPDEYYVTGPIEVAIQPFIETGIFPNGTWFNGTVRWELSVGVSVSASGACVHECA